MIASNKILVQQQISYKWRPLIMMIPPLYIKQTNKQNRWKWEALWDWLKGRRNQNLLKFVDFLILKEAWICLLLLLFSQTQQLDFSRFRHTLKYTETDKVTHLQSYKDRSMLIGPPKHPRLDFLYDLIRFLPQLLLPLSKQMKCPRYSCLSQWHFTKKI